MKHCENCLRHTAIDRTEPHRINNVLIPAYLICTYCGWCHGAEEANA